MYYYMLYPLVFRRSQRIFCFHCLQFLENWFYLLLFCRLAGTSNNSLITLLPPRCKLLRAPLLSLDVWNLFFFFWITLCVKSCMKMCSVAFQLLWGSKQTGGTMAPAARCQVIRRWTAVRFWLGADASWRPCLCLRRDQQEMREV